ncbi:hypothetical protein [Novilysobacter erysipheiresistens]|uniref:Uncharacterized protein n=1 Tax=Novilysobacter erysipheiresistens TaxID=1749332 RepID=A0ABU7YUB9_9GAMM
MRYETPEEVLQACVDRLGGNKRVGVMLWPELEEKPDVAARKLSDHLNENHAAKFSLSQAQFILRRARDVGFHEGHNEWNRQCGYSPSRPLNDADEITELQQRAMAAAEAAASASRELFARMQAAGLNVENVA